MRLYVTDLDGTLLNKKGRLSEKTKEDMTRLLEAGVNITVASARGVASIRSLLKGVPITLPIIAFNGAYVSDYKTGQHYVINDIHEDLFDRLYPYGVLVSLHDRGEDSLVSAGNLSEGAKAYIRDRKSHLGLEVDHTQVRPQADIMAYTVIGEKETILSLESQLGEKDNLSIHVWEDMYYRPWYWLSIHSKMASKDQGIMALKGMIDEEIDEVVVFGDNINDIEMFQVADVGVAVDNAVPALKAVADKIIGNHDDNSVMTYISQVEGRVDIIQ